MAQASVADQLALLDVAELDSQIARLENDNKKHPLREKLGVLMNTTASRARDKQAGEASVVKALQELEQSEERCSTLQSQIQDKEAKLDSGEGLTSRDLLVLQGEIEALRTTLAAANDEEFEALHGVEEAELAVEKLSAQINDLKDKILADRADLEDAVAAITSEQDALSAKRDALYEPISDELKKIYEHSRASGGYAVMGMSSNGKTGVGVTLSPVEIAQIKGLEPEEIYLNEDYDAIVVRLP